MTGGNRAQLKPPETQAWRPRRRRPALTFVCFLVLVGGAAHGQESPAEGSPPTGWRMLGGHSAFCPETDLEACLTESGATLMDMLDFYRRMPERFWEGWKDSCVRPPFEFFGPSEFDAPGPALAGADARQTISASSSIVAGTIREIKVGFFAPYLGAPDNGARVYTMLLIEDMEVLKHTRTMLGPVRATPNPLRPGPFMLLAPVGSARLGGVEFCSQSPPSSPPFDALALGDQVVLFSRAGLAPAVRGADANFVTAWWPSDLAVFDSSGKAKANVPSLEESDKVEGASAFEALVDLARERGSDQ